MLASINHTKKIIFTVESIDEEDVKLSHSANLNVHVSSVTGYVFLKTRVSSITLDINCNITPRLR